MSVLARALVSEADPTITPTPYCTAPSTDASLPQAAAPATGVWVRVFYPGNYTGFISSNGQMREINSTGDQYYQSSMTSGTIDSSIEKMDRSVNTLYVEVYKDWVLVLQKSSSTPMGIVEAHAGV